MKKQVGMTGTLGVLSMFLIQSGATLLNPAIAGIAARFPEENYAMLGSVMTLFIFVTSLGCGAVVGKKVKYKVCAVGGSLLFIVGGLLSAMTESWMVILAGRAVAGAGMGLIAPLGNALVLGLYDGQKQAKLLGYGSLLMSVGGIAYQMIGGILAGYNWNTVFYGHLFGLVGLVMGLFIPEPELAAQEEKSEAKTGETKKDKLPAVVFVIGAALGIFNLVYSPVFLNVSIIYMEKGLGSAAAVATGFSLSSACGCIAGLVFGSVYKIFRRFILAFAFFLCGFSTLLIYWSPASVVVMAGLAIGGFCFGIVIPAGMGILGMRTPPTVVAFGVSVAMALFNMGGILVAFWMQMFVSLPGNSLYTPILASVVIQLILGAVFVVYNPYPKQNA